MEDSGHRRKRRDPWRLISRSTVSVVCVCFAQFALYLLSSFFNSFSIITLLFLSVMVLLGLTVIGRRCKRLFGLRGSAPAFVLTNILFIWCVYLVVIPQATSFLLDIIFHAELIVLLIGLYRISSGDPGFVNYEPISNTETYLEGLELPTSDIYEGSPSVESSLLLQRVRYCKHCHAHVKGFDHHCPAFGNCIGQNNHLLFLTLLAGFIIAEACYIVGASQITTSRTLDSDGRKVGWTVTLATSTMIFSILQVLWQAAFLAWHIYCVCFNIRTDEWMHWKKYPEFQHIIHPQPGETGTVTVTWFRNPYDKGIWQNLKEFIEARGQRSFAL
ncbi:hypothetical protein L1987_29626 [Smallanthus sonchifolius]|uniref:Uncharacterized protein n=1 Tax=Smallanthus sonchifolius TaxID=185202 RepID=A0ACB9I008_9ASTR|nr:hypothetical protein L1987_29626 [Smallanthus sonchifolius]